MSIFCRKKVQVTFPTYSCGENLGQFSFDNFSTNQVASEIEWSKFQQKLVISPIQQKINKLGRCKKSAGIFRKFVDRIFVHEMSKFPLFVWLNYFGNLLKPFFVGKILKLIEENYCQLMKVWWCHCQFRTKITLQWGGMWQSQFCLAVCPSLDDLETLIHVWYILEHSWENICWRIAEVFTRIVTQLMNFKCIRLGF